MQQLNHATKIFVEIFYELTYKELLFNRFSLID